MRRELVLAAVLSVLAGLLAVGYAQNRGDDGPQAFELRRDLIDQVEAAYASDDADALAALATVQAKMDANEAWLTEVRRHIAETRETPNDNSGGLERVTSAFGFDVGAFGLCLIGESFGGVTCGSNLAYCTQGTTVGGDPDSDTLDLELEIAELHCALEYEHCMNDVQDKVNLCKTLAVLIPG